MAEGDGIDTASAGVTSRTVFLSYASHDTEIANTVCRELESRGIRCWIAPRDVAPGALYADAIVRAINEANILVVVLSQSAVASSHVGREVERAASKHKQIIALRIDAAPLSPELEYFLSNSQWIDVAALGMPGALAKLAEAVGQNSASSSRTNPANGAAATLIRKRSGGAPKRVMVAVGVVIVAVGTAALGLRFWPSKHGDAQAPAIAQISDKSIAVLPFADMSQKKDQEYFGDGMAEEIIDLLAKIPGLTVIGRTSSFQFKGKNEDLRTIGTKLNAAYVLEGSVRNSGDQVRITAQLINTRTGAHEWSETYDRPIGDVLKLQDTIAAGVARELQLTVAPDYLSSRPTPQSAEIYDVYLRGRHAFDRHDAEGFDEASSLFQRALDGDSTFVDAAVWLAWAKIAQGQFGILTPAGAYEPARRAAMTALTLDSNNPHAHVALGQIHIEYDWDWAAAEREARQVANLAPGSAAALYVEMLLSSTLGRWDDELRQVKAFTAQDPLEAENFARMAEIQLNRDHLPEAEAAIRKMLDIRPTYGFAHYYLGIALLRRGDRDAALIEIQQEATDDAKQQGLAIVYYALGRKAESDTVLAGMLRDQATRNAVGIADVYALRGQSDQAMQWLERAYVQRDPELCHIKSEIELQTLRADPRFKAFLRKMNLPE